MVYDCFLYYDEDMMLDIRLNTLDPVVDKFVIVESTHSFRGDYVGLAFDISKFEKFKDKIIYVIFDEKPKTDNKNGKENYITDFHRSAWENEKDTRNAIMRGLVAAQDDDVIIVSDVDEIINPQAIKDFNKKYLCTTLNQTVYNYQFNLQVFNIDGSPRKASLPRMTTFKKLKKFFNGEPETFRNIKRSHIRKNFIKWRWFKLRNKINDDGGWHFSRIMSPERIVEKMSTISHEEYDTPDINNIDHIINVITSSKDIWNRERKLIKQKLTCDKFPEFLVNNRNKFSDFILPD